VEDLRPGLDAEKMLRSGDRVPVLQCVGEIGGDEVGRRRVVMTDERVHPPPGIARYTSGSRPPITTRRAVTELERITTDPAGAAGPVRRRPGRGEWQTLCEALDNPDDDLQYAVQREQARRRGAEREAAEREVQRPVGTRCGNRGRSARDAPAARVHRRPLAVDPAVLLAQ
jgi:hypothetical protein